MNALNEPITQIAEYSPTANALAELREKYAAVVFHCASADGMTAARIARAELRTLRTNLERLRQEIKAPALERCRLIDAEAKRISAELHALEDPIDAQINAEESRKEAERQERIRQEAERAAVARKRVQAIRDLPLSMLSNTAAEIVRAIATAEQIDTSAFVGMAQAEAELAKTDAITKLREMHQRRQESEAQEARLAAERAELAQCAAEQAEANRLAQEACAADQRRINAELAAKREELTRIEREQAEARATADRIAAAKRAQEEAALRQRIAEEAAQRRAQEAVERAERDAAEQVHRELEQREADARLAQQDAEDRRLCAEKERLAQAAAELALQRAEAERAAREQAIAEATLIDAAREAHALLCDLGKQHHIATLKLGAALAREALALGTDSFAMQEAA